MTGRTLRVWRIGDGRPGHERQTGGLVRALRREVRVDEEVLRVPLSRFPHCPDSPRPDLLMGAGRRTHPALMAASLVTGAPSLVLMDPGPLRRWCFDYRIVPWHDGLPPSPGTLVVDGVLNPLWPGGSPDMGRGLILVGGPSAHVDWSDDSMEEQVRKVATRFPGVRWTLSNSRRTPAGLLERLETTLSPTNLLCVDHRSTGSGWLPEQLQSSGQAWVSPDSVSMVYEALTAGCRVGVFDIDWGRPSRVRRGLDRLAREGMVTRLAELGDRAELPPPPRRLEEAARSARWLLAQLGVQVSRRSRT